MTTSRPPLPTSLQAADPGTARVPYGELSYRAQVERMRRVALDALRQYPIEPRRLRLLLHGYNTTFRVDTHEGQRWALRINVSQRAPLAKLDAEMAWLHALAGETSLQVPAPLPTRDGALYTTVASSEFGRQLPVAVMSWLPGRDLDPFVPAAAPALGELAATLHAHGERWRLPAQSWLPPLDDVLIGDVNRFERDHPLLDDAQREVLRAAMGLASQATSAVCRRVGTHPLHADLHGGNLKWLRGAMAVFDFDDAGIGAPIQDLAIAAYYLRPDAATADAAPGAARLEAGVLEGYARVRPLPDVTHDEFEALVAGRNLLLLNDLLDTAHAEYRELVPRYLANTVTKLRAYLDTGVYRHDVPGLVTAG